MLFTEKIYIRDTLHTAEIENRLQVGVAGGWEGGGTLHRMKGAHGEHHQGDDVCKRVFLPLAMQLYQDRC